MEPHEPGSSAMNAQKTVKTRLEELGVALWKRNGRDRRPSRADPIRLGWRGSHDVFNPTTPGAVTLPGVSKTWELNCLIQREKLLHSLHPERHASESGDSRYPIMAYCWPRVSNVKHPRFVAFLGSVFSESSCGLQEHSCGQLISLRFWIQLLATSKYVIWQL